MRTGHCVFWEMQGKIWPRSITALLSTLLKRRHIPPSILLWLLKKTIPVAVNNFREGFTAVISFWD